MVKKKSKAKQNTTSSFQSILNFEKIFHNEKVNFTIGLTLAAVAVYLFLAFASYLSTGDADQSIIEMARDGEILNKEHIFKNSCGSFGAHAAYFFIKRCFGMAAFVIPVMLILLGLRLMRIYYVNLWKWMFSLSLVMILTSVAFAKFLTSIFADSSFNPGGDHGLFICGYIENIIGAPGLTIILLIIAISFFTYLTIETIYVIRKLFNPLKYVGNKVKFTINNATHSVDTPETAEVNEETPAIDGEMEETETPLSQTVEEEDPSGDAIKEYPDVEAPLPDEEEEEDEKQEEDDNVDLQINETEVEDKASGKELVEVGDKQLEPYDPKRDLENYRYPTLDLLKKSKGDGKPYIDMAEQTAKKDRIIEVLRNFGVEISSIKATVGPTITLYEITPAQGVRIAKIRSLEDDIALSLAALGIRIIAPIPGKGTIGIEVPNENPNTVSMESILNSKKFQEAAMELPCAIGKTITNEVFMFDLAKIPHLLVAGATGKGKSVGLNAIITSLLYKKHPAELKIVLIDPKKVEFSIYGSIVNHFLAQVPSEDDEPVITDVTKVVRTLNSLCKEMDTRYDLLKIAGVRNIKEYNKKFTSRQLNPEKGHKYMPYIVVVVDEFGDLIMTAGREIELPIARIAQLARAVGIHMIIATQRPTTNIITGTIKANFPGRIAFQVAAMIDSKTILDRPGANQLIGKGDLLFMQGSEPVRVQCAFVDTPEVERINNFISQQQGYIGPYELPEPDMGGDEGGGGAADVDMQHLDPLFADAARLIVINQSGSTSLIQRKFSIGYNRAGRLMDQLEKAGVVGAASGSKPREVLIQDEVSLENLINSFR